GVPLSVMLDQATPKPNACEVVLEGADHGILEDPKSPPGGLKFARSIPLQKARRDVLLAYKMNGEDLPPAPGFPPPPVGPGCYSVASGQWLQRSSVRDRTVTRYYQGSDCADWQKTEYGRWRRGEEIAELTPISEMQVKAEIARPAEGEPLGANANVCVSGAA